MAKRKRRILKISTKMSSINIKRDKQITRNYEKMELRKTKTAVCETSNYRVVSVKIVNNRIYQLIEISSQFSNREERANFLQKLIENAGAIGLIEWWPKGSIVKKPRNIFRCVLIFGIQK